MQFAAHFPPLPADIRAKDCHPFHPGPERWITGTVRSVYLVAGRGQPAAPIVPHVERRSAVPQLNHLRPGRILNARVDREHAIVRHVFLQNKHIPV